MENYEEKLGELSAIFLSALKKFNEETKAPPILGVLAGQRLLYKLIAKDEYENMSA